MPGQPGACGDQLRACLAGAGKLDQLRVVGPRLIGIALGLGRPRLALQRAEALRIALVGRLIGGERQGGLTVGEQHVAQQLARRKQCDGALESRLDRRRAGIGEVDMSC